LNEGNSVRRTALLSRSSLATAFKVSTLIRERKEVKEIKSIDIIVPKTKLSFTGSALEWINLPKNKAYKDSMTPEELSAFVSKRAND